MYISGVPGTGKTATVTAVLESMRGFVDESGRSILPAFKFISINGMQVSEPRQAYVQIYEVAAPMLFFYLELAYLSIIPCIKGPQRRQGVGAQGHVPSGVGVLCTGSWQAHQEQWGGRGGSLCALDRRAGSALFEAPGCPLLAVRLALSSGRSPGCQTAPRRPRDRQHDGPAGEATSSPCGQSTRPKSAALRPLHSRTTLGHRRGQARSWSQLKFCGRIPPTDWLSSLASLYVYILLLYVCSRKPSSWRHAR